MRVDELPRRAQRLFAEIALNLSNSPREALIQFADVMLEEGFYSYHLGELSASNNHLNVHELKIVHEKAIRELSIPSIPVEEAIGLALEIALSEIAETNESIEDLLLRLPCPLWFDERTKVLRNAIDEAGCSRLYEWRGAVMARLEYGEYEYRSEQEADQHMAWIATQAIEFSRGWIRQRLRLRVDLAWHSWRERTIHKLAESIQQQAAFGQLPILADALEEAGCTDRAILDHCRDGTPHHRYCWVADLFVSTDADSEAQPNSGSLKVAGDCTVS